jgi:hypothetical protein
LRRNLKSSQLPLRLGVEWLVGLGWLWLVRNETEKGVHCGWGWRLVLYLERCKDGEFIAGFRDWETGMCDQFLDSKSRSSVKWYLNLEGDGLDIYLWLRELPSFGFSLSALSM